ncbi:hypothetical protein [Bradyrhizobium yuanmingense]|uniref:hypothetical protein n=1 Tax=Bradyrhizobium yuanmingense TaxID=108015 RepID=UPI0005680DC2|nr:hypothetical protein [Bradyrhizobium yuanmingense]
MMTEGIYMTEPRMDGTLEQRLLWRVEALREALSDIGTMKDGVSHQIARNALAVDDGNAKLCFSAPTQAAQVTAQLLTAGQALYDAIGDVRADQRPLQNDRVLKAGVAWCKASEAATAAPPQTSIRAPAGRE